MHLAGCVRGLATAALPAYERTTVRLPSAVAGTFGFACGMNMIHGTLIVDPAQDAGHYVPPPGDAAGRVQHDEPARGSKDRFDTGVGAEAGQAAERRAEIAESAGQAAKGHSDRARRAAGELRPLLTGSDG